MDFEQNIQPEVIPGRPGQKCVYCSELAPSVMCNPTLIQPIRGQYSGQKCVHCSELAPCVMCNPRLIPNWRLLNVLSN